MEHVRPLVDTAADQLVDYIINNSLSRGARLPNEFELAKHLGVGRSTLREAVKMLVSRNVLEVRQGSGTFVTGRTTMGISDDPLGLTFIKDKEKLAFDLLEIRISIEPRLANLAAQHRTPQELDDLERLCDEVERRISIGNDYVEVDAAFHTKIAEMSKNIVAPNITTIVCQAITVFVEVTGQKLTRETIETHRLLLEAIRDRDSTAAQDAMMMHLIYNRNEFRRIFKLKNEHN